MMIGGVQLQPPGAAVTTTVAQATQTPAVKSKVDNLVESIGGVKAIEEMARLMVEVANAELALKKKKKLYEAFTANTLSKAAELGIAEDTVLNGESHALVLKYKSGNTTTEVEDKTKLYNFMESKAPGMFFQLCKIGVGDLKEYIPETAYSSAGIKKGNAPSSLGLSAKVIKA